MNKKTSLPPRKWYTLEQASERLSNETGSKVSVDYLIHALFKGAFLPYIHVDYKINNYISFNGKYRVDLSDGYNVLIEDIHSTVELNYKDVKMMYDCCNLAIQGVDYKNNNLDKWLIPYVENLIEKMTNEYGEVNDRAIYSFFKKYKKRIFGINGLLALKIECLYNGSSLISEEFELLNNGLRIKEQDLLSPPIIGLNGKGIFLRLKVENEFYISAKDLIIVHDDLLRVKNNFRANLQGFAEFADEQGILPDNIPPYFLDWEEQENREENEQKTIEKTAPRMENYETKNPIQYGKEYTKKLVIESCLATRKEFPTAGKNTIVKAVLSKISNDPKMKGLKLQSERTYTNILDKMGIEFPDEKGKTIEISKVIIVKP
ncbi:hypothetical protein [Ursidibacter sp. B-7004-1]